MEIWTFKDVAYPFIRMLQQHGFQECTFFPPDDSSVCKNDTKSLRDPMEYEGKRLSTFATFPDIPGLYATKLAGAGFYFLQKDDEVCCFKCRITYKNWNPHDSPIKIHQQISPLCDFIKHVASKYIEHSQHISESIANNGTCDISYVRTECDQTSHDKNKLPVNSNNPQQSLHILNGGTVSQRIQANSINQNSNNFRWNVPNTYGGRVPTNPCLVNQSLNNTTDNVSNTDITRTESYQISNNYSTNDTNSLIPISHTDLETLNRNASTPNNQYSGQITTTDRSSKAPVKQPMMGICVDNPKYPKYAIRGSRLDSFKYWPTYLTQSPDEMATAGFFFTGNDDHCRCFFCGGGLKNWEPGDEPWVEHARWYQKCDFVRQCKGDSFIGDVQTNKYMPTEIVKKSKLPSSKRPLGEFKNIPAVRSVTEFGYDEKLVKEAYETLQKAGKSDITITGLLEAVFNLEENSKHTQENSNYNQQQMENSQSAIESAKSIAKQITNETTSDSEPELSVRSLEEENQNLKDQQTCKICLDEPIAIVFLPCGHLAACGRCAPALRRCPICRAFIKGSVKAIMC
ncbi:baculoviral IAP repeat-containing protein 3-like [Mytilus californianus]|uniref:baculoviral IAP repeat-containing protein 3-like n=1 Tax=Mytilus californianus TaxID=6549 RepID=UPI0022481E01|nr:baculoviral IAP repeat-containing protein 3-like [Mytilus californianus]